MANAIQALAAKRKFHARFGRLPELAGVGIGGSPGDYHVAVRLTSPASRPLPDSIDGVPVVVVIIGKIRPL